MEPGLAFVSQVTGAWRPGKVSCLKLHTLHSLKLSLEPQSIPCSPLPLGNPDRCPSPKLVPSRAQGSLGSGRGQLGTTSPAQGWIMGTCRGNVKEEGNGVKPGGSQDWMALERCVPVGHVCQGQASLAWWPSGFSSGTCGLRRRVSIQSSSAIPPRTSTRGCWWQLHSL